MSRRRSTPKTQQVESYQYPQANSPMRPDVGTQSLFRKKKTPQAYAYDSSLSPALEWDGQNPAREQGEAAIAEIEGEIARLRAELPEQLDIADPEAVAAALNAVGAARKKIEAAVKKLRSLGQPFLNWAGKAERLSFDVPTLPLFVHERLSTEDIIKTLQGHQRNKQQILGGFYDDPRHSVANQVMRAYEYLDPWVNRLILGDSLVVMNSLLHYESLGGQVQMIYMDPPYGVKFGSNFQPFVRKRDVKHNDDEFMTREPEMVQAYRDTWELGLHSYLTYLRDRLLLARELLTDSGSIFVQISDDNLHHVREVIDEVFGVENFVSQITFSKTTGATGVLLPGTADYLLWYAKNKERVKFRQIFLNKKLGSEGSEKYDQIELRDGTRRSMTREEKENFQLLPEGARPYRLDNLMSQSVGRDKGLGAACWFPVQFEGRKFLPNERNRWKTNEEGMDNLLKAGRIQASANSLAYSVFGSHVQSQSAFRPILAGSSS